MPNPGEIENLTSFRAVADHASLHASLGPLANLPGRWSGKGFNLIARPDFQGDNDIFLELNLTKESLVFETIGSPIPNRGSEQDDITLFGLHYLQQISDRTTGGALHIEPGIWINIPQTQQPAAQPTVARLATIPHGDAANLGGTSDSVNDGPDIQPANTVPFEIGSPVPPPGAPNTFPEYDLAVANAFRTNPVPPEITQAMISDPNTVLQSDIAGQRISHTDVLIVDSATSGGIANIPFVVANANAVSASSTFWIETVEPDFGIHHMQLQYTQTVLLNFDGLSWPHVSVATLTKTFERRDSRVPLAMAHGRRAARRRGAASAILSPATTAASSNSAPKPVAGDPRPQPLVLSADRFLTTIRSARRDSIAERGIWWIKR
jgi:hypothetical protein